MRHPATEGKAAAYHLAIGLWYVAGLYFHFVSAWRHWRAM